MECLISQYGCGGIYIYICMLGSAEFVSRCVYGWRLSTAKSEGLKHILCSFLFLAALLYVNVLFCFVEVELVSFNLCFVNMGNW